MLAAPNVLHCAVISLILAQLFYYIRVTETELFSIFATINGLMVLMIGIVDDFIDLIVFDSDRNWKVLRVLYQFFLMSLFIAIQVLNYHEFRKSECRQLLTDEDLTTEDETEIKDNDEKFTAKVEVLEV